MKRSFFTKNWVIVLLHILCWIIIFSLPFLLKTSYKSDHKPPEQTDNAYVTFYVSSSILWVGLFYLNGKLLIPLFAYKRKIWQFIVIHLAALFLIYSFHQAFFVLFLTKANFTTAGFFIYNTFPYLFIITGSSAYAMIIDRQRSVHLAREKETENLKTELLFLRSQVSPHFMFNVLNNMVALARKKSDLLEPSLIKLSSLMRYMLYETDEQKVLIEKEIDYIQSYIDLQQQRFGKNVKVNTLFNNINGANEIEPMLLIPFVENAFKHGTGIIENAEINIELREDNGIFQFIVSNKYNDAANGTKDKSVGIGLTNVQRRLNLLYGKNHSLLINKKNGWYTISLQLNLH